MVRQSVSPRYFSKFLFFRGLHIVRCYQTENCPYILWGKLTVNLVKFFKVKKEWSVIISFITFWDFPMFYQIFLSVQVKRCAIITYKHGIYELPHELPKDLRLRILGN